MNLLLALVLASCSFAGVELDLVARLRDSEGFRCTENQARDGYACVKDRVLYVLIPKELPALQRYVFYAHGDVSVCGNGASGERFLLDKMPPLLRKGAIALFPYRANDRDLSYPFAQKIAWLENLFGQHPWTMAGHSWGGKFIARKLAAHPDIAARVDDVFLLDVGYDVDFYAPYWVQVCKSNSNLKIRSLANTTFSKTESMKTTVNKSCSGVFTNQRVGGQHCEAPNFFQQL